MSKQPFMPRTDLERELWIKNFSTKLPFYAQKYNISSEEQVDTAQGSAYFSYWVNYRNQHFEYDKKLTQFKNDLINGVPIGATPSVVPDAPGVGTVPPEVPPGIFVRASALAVVIKSKSVYTIADGNDLGIEGAASEKDLHSMKPILTLRLIEGGKPEIQWTKQGMDAIEIHVDRGDGNWTFLAVDTYPHYMDTTPLAADVQSTIWKYKAIYRFDDVYAGMWSDVASITISK